MKWWMPCVMREPDRIGIRVSPIGPSRTSTTAEREADALYLIEELAKRGIAICHMSEPTGRRKPLHEAFRQIRGALPRRDYRQSLYAGESRGSDR
ncbi:MAG: hypothetical protein ACLTXH_04460 [Enterobacter hormaechei]